MRVLSISKDKCREKYLLQLNNIKALVQIPPEKTIADTYNQIRFNNFDMIIVDYDLEYFFGNDLVYYIANKILRFPVILLTDKTDEVYENLSYMNINQFYDLNELSSIELNTKILKNHQYYHKLIEHKKNEYEELIENFKIKPSARLESEIEDIVKFLRSVPFIEDKDKYQNLNYGSKLLDNLLNTLDEILKSK